MSPQWVHLDASEWILSFAFGLIVVVLMVNMLVRLVGADDRLLRLHSADLREDVKTIDLAIRTAFEGVIEQPRKIDC